MLTITLSIGIPLAYVIVGMFISRNYWFKTRNLKRVDNFMSCNGCRTFAEHKNGCLGDHGVALRTFKSTLLVFLWPIGGFTSGLGYIIRKFYESPVRKLERNREKLNNEIEVLRTGASEYERDSAAWQTMMDMVSVKTKELKGMK